MKITKIILMLTVLIGLVSCGNKEKKMKNTVLEVTTFSLKTTANSQTFNKLDSKIQDNFTSKQPGFIRRESGVNENGVYTVIVYWKTMTDAEASMKKFMGDVSVADYASMIEGSTMKMNRYTINTDFNANNSKFIEMMSFNLNDNIDKTAFNAINEKVADKTATQKGFIQRITGVDESGKQVVLIYWDTQEDSNAYLQPFMNNSTSKEFMGMMNQPSIVMTRSQVLTYLKETEMTNKNKVVALLNSFNNGDKTPISYINPEKYIQHNLGVADGLAGFGAVMQNAPEGGFKANVIRAFEDGEYVFTHTEYDFFGPKAGFDVFRFENGLIVEHWDNLLEVQKPNPSGRTQFDGATEIKDLDKTEANKKIVANFIEKVLLGHEMDKLTTYINPEKYLQHNPAVADGLDGFGAAMKYFAENGLVMEYTKLHKVLGEGNFVLSISEGKFDKGEHTAFYDLFRLEDGKIVEHWDVISTIPSQSEWKNNNGKF
ncbi:nuclear transport factor 2 family protein [uncultured Lacinutrix sp.]|uniref:nuclear transport factor 2 family protein n=1 Tax=uncultured Lacinutrix sp. TaxID=574032 RepID=UPI0026244549|nr:nuclear transport factor 2 family protein [uncultured Lacinutrix sp.]